MTRPLPEGKELAPARTFLATHRDSVAGRYSREGLTLDQVIREIVQECEAERAHATGRGDAPGEFEAKAEDYVIWEGAKCVAVVRSRPDGGHRVVVFEAKASATAEDD